MPERPFHDLAVSRDGEGRTSKYTYYGTRSEMETLAASHTVGEAGSGGRLKALKFGLEKDTVWKCELDYELNADGSTAEAPDTGWGVRSCRLRGGMLSRPLEAHPDYRTKWNHYLFARSGISALPQWYASATDTTVPAADRDNYVWSARPDGAGDGFAVLTGPTKSGVDSFDTAVYTVTEAARFRTASAAGAMVAAKLNKIDTPSETFGNSSGSWKCDDAEVTWGGKYWIAKLTWTRSADDGGWDAELYGSGGSI